MKEKILEAAVDAFNEKGLKFTMDDLAKRLSMSKKTLYTVFEDKQELFFAMVDYCFAAIKDAEKRVLEDESLDIVDRIQKLIVVLPDKYKGINLRQVYLLKEKYPKVYKEVEKRLENDWEPTIALLNQAMEQKRIRPINVYVFKTMVEGTIEQFFQKSVLVDRDISYEQAMEEMVTILVRGICI